MEKYNYLEAVTADAKEWLLEHYEPEFIAESDNYSQFYDEMFTEDSVTGNASGSYFFNAWKAEEALCHNMHYLMDAAEEFGYSEIPQNWIESAETADVIIRIYFLDTAIIQAIKEIKEEREEDEE